jgi:hypothetical protein
VAHRLRTRYVRGVLAMALITAIEPPAIIVEVRKRKRDKEEWYVIPYEPPLYTIKPLINPDSFDARWESLPVKKGDKGK